MLRNVLLNLSQTFTKRQSIKTLEKELLVSTLKISGLDIEHGVSMGLPITKFISGL